MADPELMAADKKVVALYRFNIAGIDDIAAVAAQEAPALQLFLHAGKAPSSLHHPVYQLESQPVAGDLYKHDLIAGNAVKAPIEGDLEHPDVLGPGHIDRPLDLHLNSA